MSILIRNYPINVPIPKDNELAHLDVNGSLLNDTVTRLYTGFRLVELNLIYLIDTTFLNGAGVF